MSLTAIFAGWPTFAALGNGASVGGSVSGDSLSDFAGMLADPALTDAENLIPAAPDYAVAFDAGMLSQSPKGPIVIADTTAEVLSSLAGRVDESHVASKPDVVAKPSSRSPVRTPLAQTGTASILQAALTSTQSPSLSPQVTASSAISALQFTAVAGVFPGIDGEISSPIISESPAPLTALVLEISLPTEPTAGRAQPDALTTSDQPALKNHDEASADARLSVVDTAEGAVISYIAPQDASPSAELKAIAESLMAEYAIPLGRLAYKAALLPLTAAQGGGD